MPGGWGSRAMLDIHALRVFLEAAKTENFTEAGRSLSLTQPAVSMQIRSLENYLQLELFERDGRNIRLTKAGQALVPMAQQIVQMAISAEENIRASNGRVVGNLTIGCSTASGKYILPHVVARFQRLYPDVHVAIPVVSRERVLDGVTSGEYDVGVVGRRAPGADIHYFPFFTDRLVLIVPTSHRWARAGVIAPAELLTERFICREPEASCRLITARELAKVGVNVDDLDIVMEVGNPEALAMAVEYGIGVSFVSLLAANPRLMLGRLAIVEVEGVDLRNDVEIVCSCGRPASPVQTEFLSFVSQQQTRLGIEMLADGRIV